MIKPQIVLKNNALENDEEGKILNSNSELQNAFEKAHRARINYWDFDSVTESEMFKNFIKASKLNRKELFLSVNDELLNPMLDLGNYKSVEDAVQLCLKTLETDYIDMFWISSPDNLESILPQFAKLIKEGKIKSIGVSNFELDQIQKAEVIASKEGIEISAVKDRYSLLDRTAEDKLKYCKEKGIDFWGTEVLAVGALTGKYGTNNPFPEKSLGSKRFEGKLKFLDNLIERMKKIAKNHNVNPSVLAIAWAKRKGVIPVVGVDNERQVQASNLALNIPLTQAEIQTIEKYADKVRFGVPEINNAEIEEDEPANVNEPEASFIPVPQQNNKPEQKTVPEHRPEAPKPAPQQKPAPAKTEAPKPAQEKNPLPKETKKPITEPKTEQKPEPRKVEKKPESKPVQQKQNNPVKVQEDIDKYDMYLNRYKMMKEKLDKMTEEMLDGKLDEDTYYEYADEVVGEYKRVKAMCQFVKSEISQGGKANNNQKKNDKTEQKKKQQRNQPVQDRDER